MEKENKNATLEDDCMGDDLLSALQSCTQFTPPDGFLSSAVMHFEGAVKRRLVAVWTVGILATISIATPLLWLGIIYIKDVILALAALARGTAVVVDLLATMWSQLPEMSTGIVLALWMILFVFAVLLVKVFKMTPSEETLIGQEVG